MNIELQTKLALIEIFAEKEPEKAVELAEEAFKWATEGEDFGKKPNVSHLKPVN